MSKEKVTSINKFLNQQPKNPLDLVCASIKEWRQHKKRRSEKIPSNIWDQIFVLIQNMPTSKVLGALNITREQFNNKCLERNLIEYIDDLEPSDFTEECNSLADFCAVETRYPLASKPAKAFATNTSIVELYRPDGMLMKIHICTDSFAELLDAFFKGKV